MVSIKSVVCSGPFGRVLPASCSGRKCFHNNQGLYVSPLQGYTTVVASADPSTDPSTNEDPADIEVSASLQLGVRSAHCAALLPGHCSPCVPLLLPESRDPYAWAMGNHLEVGTINQSRAHIDLHSRMPCNRVISSTGDRNMHPLAHWTSAHHSVSWQVQDSILLSCIMSSVLVIETLHGLVLQGFHSTA